MISNEGFDPIKDALENIQRINQLAALQSKVRILEARLEALREAGDELWYVVRHSEKVATSDFIDACNEWRAARAKDATFNQ